ncbi:transposase [Paraburkholderia sp. BL9I2N2]|uniref:transposase n=1 Tax=Paraburkholderia sp. BL9I2N2 TaxID=1938809 RepID=UPI001049F796|nr:transposase [Paraburkholderia sp. BL9I2N2]
MGKHRTPFPAEFRAHLVELVKAGRTPEELAREFEPATQSIINWVARADRDSGVRHDGLTRAERQELTRLRRKVGQLVMERDILSHAAAWFARESGALMPARACAVGGGRHLHPDR